MPGNGAGQSLRDLAGLYGIQLAHRDGFGRRRRPGRETLLALLKALGAGIESAAEAVDAVRRRRSEIAARVVEPTQVSWSSRKPVFRLALDAKTGRRHPLRLTLTDESGTRHELSSDRSRLKVTGRRDVDGRNAEELAWPLPPDLPEGIYDCVLESGGASFRSTFLRSPVQAAALPEEVTERRLGLFLPAYAARTGRSLGMGDFSDLASFMDLARETGAGAVATLPLLAVFEDDPSPYSPMSRLLWNEIYIDPRAVPEYGSCDAAREIVESESFRRTAATLERSEFVDYPEQYRLRRPALQALTDYAAATPSLKAELDSFAARHPHADSYAKFRAACEKLGRPWQTWPAEIGHDLRAGEHFDLSVYNYYLNAQRLAFDQLERLSGTTRGGAPLLYLDMPLGVRGDGFDVWLKPDLFATEASAGSPPDAFFTGGQSWGLPPLRPEALRRDGYRYLRDSIRHIAAHAGIVRIDHVMSMHRLFWVPNGMDASGGAYVRYASEEMYAVATLESKRAGAPIVGEDLGTVPRYVGPAMDRHRLYRMYAAYFNIRPGSTPSMVSPGPDMFAYVNTHDMATFTSFLDGSDIEDRQRRGLLTEKEMRSEQAERVLTVDAMRRQLESDGLLAASEHDPRAILKALLTWLRRSAAAMLVINLEDLWLESRPQNTPGTTGERPNWKGRSRMTLEQIEELLNGLFPPPAAG